MKKIIWLTGLSGSGKTTIATNFKKKYDILGNMYILDGDVLRNGLCKDLGFSVEDRKENIRRAAHVAKILQLADKQVIVSFITPTNEIRKMVTNIIGRDKMYMIHVKASLEECERRDVKGLYAKARKGEIPQFTGISSPFDIPDDVDLVLNTENESLELTIERLFQFLDENGQMF